MSYKEFINLGRHDSSLVVTAPLLAIRNAVDSAVTGVSAVSQAAASYAKQYSVVEKQEVDSEGHVTDTTNTARRSVALYELFDVKRRIQQVRANIDQYLGQVPNRVLPVRTVHPVTITYAYYGGAGVDYRLRVNNAIDLERVVSIQANISEVSGDTALDLGFTAAIVDKSQSYITDTAAEIGPGGTTPRHFTDEWNDGAARYQTATSYPVATLQVSVSPGNWQTLVMALQVVDNNYEGRKMRAVIGNTGSFYATQWINLGVLTHFDLARLTMTSDGDVIITPSSSVTTVRGDPLGTGLSDFGLTPVPSGTATAQGFISLNHTSHPTDTVETVSWADATTLTAEIRSMLPDFASIIEDIDAMTVDA